MTVVPPVRAEAGTVVSGAVQRGEQVSSKLFSNGGFRESSNDPEVAAARQAGSTGLKAKVPNRKKDYGAEGE